MISVLCGSYGYFVWLSRGLRPHGRQAMELEEATATREMVRRGRAIACLLRCTVAAELDAGSLVSLTVKTQLPQLKLYCGHTGLLNESGQSFMSYLRAKAA